MLWRVKLSLLVKIFMTGKKTLNKNDGEGCHLGTPASLRVEGWGLGALRLMSHPAAASSSFTNHLPYVWPLHKDLVIYLLRSVRFILHLWLLFSTQLLCSGKKVIILLLLYLDMRNKMSDSVRLLGNVLLEEEKVACCLL